MQKQSVGEESNMCPYAICAMYVPCKNVCHVKKLPFKFLAQNRRTYESWWFLLT
jgi:hypothetical protein